MSYGVEEDDSNQSWNLSTTADWAEKMTALGAGEPYQNPSVTKIIASNPSSRK